MKTPIKVLLLLLFNNIFILGVLSQDKNHNPIYTAVPSLGIGPDAIGTGLGEVGAATLPNVYSQYWNPAKYAFASSKSAVAISYTPWLSKVVDDIVLMNLVGYYKLNSNQALSASIRYFSIGDVDIYDARGNMSNTVAPYEFAVDLGYSLKLTKTFSASVAMRYIRADYSSMKDEDSPSSAWAADIAGYNESYVSIGESESLLGIGFNISNIGNKMSNKDGNLNMFIPTNLRIGASLLYPIDNLHAISLSVDVNKLLVPTPPTRDSSGENYERDLSKYYNTSSISGIFKSFSDAPGGFSEEMKEISYGIGLEYIYDYKLKLRTGYFHENKIKGNRQHLTFGAGFKWSAFQLDAAYVLGTRKSNPIDNTFQLSLSFDIDDH